MDWRRFGCSLRLCGKVHAVQRRLHTVCQARGKRGRPLRNCLRIYADSLRSFGYGASKQGNSFVFGHAQMLACLQSKSKHSNIYNK